MKPLSRSRRVSPSGTLTPSSHKRRSPRRIMKENLNPNPIPPGSAFRPPSGLSKTRSPLPPRPPVNPLKRKLNLETLSDPAPDSGVQVIVRMRPSTGDGGEEQFVKKISANSVAVMDHTFTFDSVADTSSTQYDMYVLVGLPLVENCLAGFNSSIFAYGQTGSGKTYTMWGPPSALQEDDVMRNERGLTPRVFEQLFSRISEEQVKHSDKQLKFQCRCSFLEIYNEQITDLLDPTHRNLQIREDVRAGVYVDSLLEENVCSMMDVAQLLIKGLANRRMGATNMNADSSRSHCVFTCIVESQSMNKSDGLSCIRTSRINLVDLAGSERQKLTGAAGVRLKEAGNINRSLSQLGNLINILAEVSQSGKQRHIPYRDSKLTFLLQESLGGNARLAVICAISPTQSCKNETFSTLRFAQCAKVIKNKAVVNEVARDDVNMLQEQIRQLKDELLNMKSNRTSTENRGSYSTLCKAKRSLNLLRTSLNRPTAFSGVEDESDVEMEIDEDDVERLHVHAAGRQSCCEDMPPLHSENIKEIITCFSDPKMVNGGMYQAHTPESESGSDQVFGMINVNVRGCEFKKTTMGEVCPASNTKDYGCMSESADETVNDSKSETNSLSNKKLSHGSKPLEEIGNALHNSVVANDSAYLDPFHNSSTSSRSIISSLPDPKSLNLRMSPTVRSYRRKSIRTSTSESASQKNTENLIAGSTAMNLSFAINCEPLNDLVQTNQSSLAPTEFLEDPIHNGFHVVESQRNSSSLRETSFRFSMGPSDWKPLVSASKVDVGIQTVLHESETVDDVSAFICSHCKRKTQHEHIDSGDNKDLHLVPIEGLQSSDKLKNRVPKAAQKVLAGSMRREMALEDQCVRQATEIAQLNRLVQQYKHERECNAIIEQARVYKIYRLERLMDSFLPTKEFMEEEFISLTNEHKLLKEKYEDHPEVLRVNIELNRVNTELDRYRNFVDMGERDALLGEIQDLRAQLQYYMDTSLSTRKLGTVLHPTHSGKPVSTHSGAVLYPTHSGKPVSTHSGEPTSSRRKISELSEDIVDPSSEPTLAPSSTIEESTERSAYATFEQEGSCGIETESKWIALSEELRVELEASRYFAEKLKMEIDSEKNSTKELKEALKTAMKGNARILEQYAELEEEHTVLLRTHRKLSDGIEDVKREAAKAGVKGAESRFINSLAAEISALRVQREKERQSWMDENRVLQAQLRDTAEAVQTAGELIVRLKEAEEAALFAQKRATTAEKDTERAYQEMENLKKSYDRHIATLNHRLAESRLPKETLHPTTNEADVAKYVREGSPTDKSGREELEPFHRGDSEFSKGTDPYTWYSGYDRCNI